MPTPCALTVAGSDSSGGAGIQADLKTFTVLGVYGASAITAITAQNTRGVTEVQLLPSAMVRAQLEVVLSDLAVSVVKTGMLGSAAIVHEVCAVLSSVPDLPVVVDPVMVAKSGHVLLDQEAKSAVASHLLPLATVLTPNLHEARELTGRAVVDLEGMEAAARRLAAWGADWVVVKGGHLAGDASDLVWDGKRATVLRADRVRTRHTHGTGCTFAAAIAAFLALGDPVPRAILRAKSFISAAIRTAPGLGCGHGPVNHLHWLGKDCPEAPCEGVTGYEPEP
jgi:hydroxymethylpyrimidine/phosphomethylpyrimidine kinase